MRNAYKIVCTEHAPHSTHYARISPICLGAVDVALWGIYGKTLGRLVHELLPVILLFFLAQKYFIQGIVFTGVKG